MDHIQNQNKMKKAILSLAVFGMALQAQAQDMLFQEKIKEENIPDIVVTAIEKDFPDYTVTEYGAIPVEYVADEVYFNPNIGSLEDYDTFQITLKSNKGELTATYDREGNLLNTSEYLKNALLPRSVRNAVAKAYPGWEFVNDSYSMMGYKGGKERQRFRIVLENHGKKLRVYTDAKGKILNHHRNA